MSDFTLRRKKMKKQNIIDFCGELLQETDITSRRKHSFINDTSKSDKFNVFYSSQLIERYQYNNRQTIRPPKSAAWILAGESRIPRFIPQTVHDLLGLVCDEYFKKYLPLNGIYDRFIPYFDSLCEYSRILNSIYCPISLIDCAVIAKVASKHPNHCDRMYCYQDNFFSGTKPFLGNPNKRIVIEMRPDRSIIGVYSYNLKP